MRKLQNLFAFGALCVAAMLFAGCGTADSGGGGGTDAGSSTTTETEGGAAGGSGTTSTTVTSGDFQLVSLNVPNMT